MILANNLQTFWDTISCNKSGRKLWKAVKSTSSGGNSNGENYETDRNESNYAGKNHGESASRNCPEKTSSKNSSGNSSRNSFKAATKQNFHEYDSGRTEALTDIK